MKCGISMCLWCHWRKHVYRMWNHLWRAERGMVSAETAITMPVLILVLVAIVGAGQYGIKQFHTCSDAGLVARAVAVGGAIPAGASAASVVRAHDSVTVTATRSAGHIGGLDLPNVTCQVVFPMVVPRAGFE